MRPSRTVAVLLFCTAVLAAQPRIWPIDDAPSDMGQAITRGNLIIVALHDAVRRELAAELAEGGPANAAMTCHIDSRLVTERLRREGVRGGRTSDRLRNSANVAPAWASSLVSQHAGRAAREVPGFAVDLGDKVGILRPIAQAPVCASCHGPVDKLSAGVRDILRQRYPADRAVGFAEGEIRGWFWLEVPKRAR